MKAGSSARKAEVNNILYCVTKAVRKGNSELTIDCELGNDSRLNSAEVGYYRDQERGGSWGGKMRGKEDGLDVLHGQRPKRATKVCTGDSAGKIGGGRFMCDIAERASARRVLAKKKQSSGEHGGELIFYEINQGRLLLSITARVSQTLIFRLSLLSLSPCAGTTY